MIKLHPDPYNNFRCPLCGIKLKLNSVVFPGMRVLANLLCENCKEEFFADFPIGHGIYYQFYYSKQSGEIYPKSKLNWFSNCLKKTINSKENHNFHNIYKCRIVRKKKLNNNMILLNCLDILYGHSFLKLLNAQYYIDNYSNFDLVIIVPKILTWIVPEKVQSVIEVDVPLDRGYIWMDEIDKLINNIILDYNKTFLSKTYCQPHYNNYNIQYYLGIEPYNLNNLKVGIKNPIITFICREDRLLSDDNNLLKLFNKISDKFNLSILRKLLILEQRNRIIKLYKLLKRRFDKIDFAVVGKGKTFSFPLPIKDLRLENIDEKDERKWCKRYSSSHLVVGIHGSNMLIPSSLSAATLELIPISRLGNFMQEILPRGIEIKDSLFRYRFLPLNCSSKVLIKTIESMIYDYPEYYKKMITHSYYKKIF